MELDNFIETDYEPAVSWLIEWMERHSVMIYEIEHEVEMTWDEGQPDDVDDMLCLMDGFVATEDSVTADLYSEEPTRYKCTECTQTFHSQESLTEHFIDKIGYENIEAKARKFLTLDNCFSYLCHIGAEEYFSKIMSDIMNKRIIYNREGLVKRLLELMKLTPEIYEKIHLHLEVS